MKGTSWSSKVLKVASRATGLNPFGFEDFETGMPGDFGDDKHIARIPEEVRKEIERRFRELEEKEAIAEKRGYERGFRQGEKDGREIGKQSMEILTRQLSELIENISAIPLEISKQYAETIKAVIYETVKKVLQVKVEEDNEIIRKSLEVAFDALNETHKVTIKLNPKDYELLETNIFDSIQGRLSEDVKVTWKPDPGIMRGGCVFETDTQFIDATMESRLRQIEKLLEKI